MENFNRRHQAKELPPLQKGEHVWVRDQHRRGQVLTNTPHPRSYLVKTDKDILRRNRSALVQTTESPRDTDQRSVLPAAQQPVQEDDRVFTPNVQRRTGVVKWSSPLHPYIPSSSTREEHPPDAPSLPASIVTRSGRIVKPVQCLDL